MESIKLCCLRASIQYKYIDVNTKTVGGNYKHMRYKYKCELEIHKMKQMRLDGINSVKTPEGSSVLSPQQKRLTHPDYNQMPTALN